MKWEDKVRKWKQTKIVKWNFVWKENKKRVKVEKNKVYISWYNDNLLYLFKKIISKQKYYKYKLFKILQIQGILT